MALDSCQLDYMNEQHSTSLCVSQGVLPRLIALMPTNAPPYSLHAMVSFVPEFALLFRGYQLPVQPSPTKPSPIYPTQSDVSRIHANPIWSFFQVIQALEKRSFGKQDTCYIGGSPVECLGEAHHATTVASSDLQRPHLKQKRE